MSTLAELRAHIDALDEELVELLCRRSALAAQTLAHKPEGAVSPEREAEVLAHVQRRNRRRLPDTALEHIMREVITLCRTQQEAPTVYYLGPTGTYSEQAAQRYFGHAMHGEPKNTIREVIDAVAACGAGGYGVVPFENSLVGAVRETGISLGEHQLAVIDSIALPIEQCLLTRQGALADIRKVYSHEVSLMQCHRWLKEHLPGVEQVAVSSNAEAMRLASLEEDSAAIGGAHGAVQYHLRVLREHIQDTAQNVTRFLVVCAEG